MNKIVKKYLSQRADYTYKFNVHTGRHGWLRLTPAYSVKIVEEIINKYQDSLRILDPFSGTATTALSAAYHGHESVTTDINPFLVWLGQTKIFKYSDTSIQSTQEKCSQIIEKIYSRGVKPVQAPPIHNIERWWKPETLRFLCALRYCIESESEKNSPERNLLLVAFCRTLIKLSNASFNHQSMSFKDGNQLYIPIKMDMNRIFSEDLRFVLDGAKQNPTGKGCVILGDSKKLLKVIDGSFDLAITSPPYANRMSYIRELRPYMYWLGFLDNARAAGELDWSAIGGTWGIATSRLLDWEPSKEKFKHPILEDALKKIAHKDNKSGKILANYIAKYFEDIWDHLNSLTFVLNKGAKIHYIVGNSVFYGVLLSVEKLYAEMLKNLGFDNVQYRIIRKRNSKKELFEFDVSAHWSGTNGL